MTEVFLAMSITLSLLAKITTKVSDIELIVYPIDLANIHE